MPTIGHDFELIDEAISPNVAELTGRPHLLSTSGPATPVTTSRANTGTPAVDAQLEVMLSGGASEVVVQGYGASLPTLSQALDLLPAGPGSIVAPEAVTSSDLLTLQGAWPKGKIVLANPPSGAIDSAITTLAGLLIAGPQGRGMGLFADWITYAKTSGTVNGPATLGIAAAIARNDSETLNTGLAAAGKRGVLRGALAIVGGQRSSTSRDTLGAAGVQTNTCIVYGQEIRNYGFRTLANLTLLPQWWDLSGTRVVMDYRAKVAAVNEESMFDQVDGQGVALGKIEALRRGILNDLYVRGALYGRNPNEAYGIGMGPTVNPASQLALGQVKVQTRMRVSPFIEHVLDQTIRRPITANV